MTFSSLTPKHFQKCVLTHNIDLNLKFRDKRFFWGQKYIAVSLSEKIFFWNFGQNGPDFEKFQKIKKVIKDLFWQKIEKSEIFEKIDKMSKIEKNEKFQIFQKRKKFASWKKKVFKLKS